VFDLFLFFLRLTDSFKAIEAKHPNIVAIDSDGVVRNAVDLFAKEKQETTDLTTAMEVSPGFWMGNTNDCPLPYGSDGDGPKNVKIDDNPVGYDICIEASLFAALWGQRGHPSYSPFYSAQRLP
jgi:hypothetical protein